MLFRKNRRPPHPGKLHSLRETVASDKVQPSLVFEPASSPQKPAVDGEPFITIDYEMMLKGSRVVRRGRELRQYLIMVGNSVRLVTSGDTVDRATYDALVAAGVVAPPRGAAQGGGGGADSD